MKELGQELRQARLARQMSLGDVNVATKIRLRYLQAIERGEVDALPGDVYVKGFLRSYGETVGLDGWDLVRRYQALREAEGPPPEEPVSQARRSRSSRGSGDILVAKRPRRKGLRWGAALLVVGVAGYLAWTAPWQGREVMGLPQPGQLSEVGQEDATVPVDGASETDGDAPTPSPGPAVSAEVSAEDEETAPVALDEDPPSAAAAEEQPLVGEAPLDAVTAEEQPLAVERIVVEGTAAESGEVGGQDSATGSQAAGGTDTPTRPQAAEELDSATEPDPAETLVTPVPEAVAPPGHVGTVPESGETAIGASDQEMAAIPTEISTDIPTDRVLLTVSVRERSWMEAHADGQRVFTGILEPGDTRTWEALELLRVRFGFPQGVDLVLNGVMLGQAGDDVITREFTVDKVAEYLDEEGAL